VLYNTSILLHFVVVVAIALTSHKPDLRKTLDIWQHKLKLNHWSIALQVVGDGALGGTSMGDIQWDVARKCASIRILREEDYDLPIHMARLDQQATIVHELVHLLHSGNPAAKSAEESAVVVQTNALLRANHAWRILAVQDY
jgi:hypothetical protein